MGKLGRMSALCALALACSKGASKMQSPDAPRTERLERVALEQLAQPVDPRFDAQGKLKPSSLRFAWLELPMGFVEVAGNTDHYATFEARDMPYEVVRDYFDARLVPQKLELARHSIEFTLAKPSHTQLAMEPLDVTLHEIDPDQRGVRIRLKLHSVSEKPLPLQTARELLARERARAQ